MAKMLIINKEKKCYLPNTKKHNEARVFDDWIVAENYLKKEYPKQREKFEIVYYNYSWNLD